MGFAETQEKPRVCSGYFQLTSLATAVACPGVGKIVILQAEGDNLRYRCDGVAPEAAVGNLLLENNSVQLTVEEASQIQIIETTGGGIANIHVFK